MVACCLSKGVGLCSRYSGEETNGINRKSVFCLGCLQTSEFLRTTTAVAMMMMIIRSSLLVFLTCPVRIIFTLFLTRKRGRPRVSHNFKILLLSSPVDHRQPRFSPQLKGTILLHPEEVSDDQLSKRYSTASYFLRLSPSPTSERKYGLEGERLCFVDASPLGHISGSLFCVST